MTLRSSVDVARKPVIAPNGVVAAGNQLAADAGVSMLERGGNAADAAVAAAFLAVVVEPWSCGIGGHRFGAVCRAVGRNRDPEPGNAGTRPRDAGHVRDRGRAQRIFQLAAGLGNGMSAFDPRPGRAQWVAPGKRPWKIAPAILAFRDGRPWLSLCASGGRTTTVAALNVLVNLIAGGDALHSAGASGHFQRRSVQRPVLSGTESY
jgi:gamma-glutamyltranspeptidase